MCAACFLRKPGPWDCSEGFRRGAGLVDRRRALTWGTTIYLRRQDLPGVKISYVPWWLALGAIGFAVVVSLVAGLYPAGRAARLNPVEALRYE